MRRHGVDRPLPRDLIRDVDVAAAGVLGLRSHSKIDSFPEMDFDLTDEQRLIRETARSFADNEIIPRVRDNDLVLDFYTHRGARRVTVLEKEHRLRIAFTPDSAWGFIDNLHATENRDVGDWRVRLWSWYNEFAI